MTSRPAFERSSRSCLPGRRRPRLRREAFFQTEIIGLSNGLIFALVALGYTLVYGIIELINFAHGDVFMLGSMLAFLLIGPIFAVTAEHTGPAQDRRSSCSSSAWRCSATAALNVSIERVAYRPLRNAPKLAPLISAIGMSFILQNVGPAAGRARPTRASRTSSGRTTCCRRFGIDGDHDQHPAAVRGRRHDPAAASS